MVDKYRIDLESFKKVSKERMIKTGMICILFVAVTWCVILLNGLYVWFGFIITGLISVFMIYEVYMLPGITRKLSTMKLIVSERELIVEFDDRMNRFPCRDLDLIKVIRVKGEVTEIILKTTYGNKLRLKNFKDMHGLYNDIISCVPVNHA